MRLRRRLRFFRGRGKDGSHAEGAEDAERDPLLALGSPREIYSRWSPRISFVFLRKAPQAPSRASLHRADRRISSPVIGPSDGARSRHALCPAALHPGVEPHGHPPSPKSPAQAYFNRSRSCGCCAKPGIRLRRRDHASSKKRGWPSPRRQQPIYQGPDESCRSPASPPVRDRKSRRQPSSDGRLLQRRTCASDATRRCSRTGWIVQEAGDPWQSGGCQRGTGSGFLQGRILASQHGRRPMHRAT